MHELAAPVPAVVLSVNVPAGQIAVHKFIAPAAPVGVTEPAVPYVPKTVAHLVKNDSHVTDLRSI